MVATIDITEAKLLDMGKKKADAMVRNQQKPESIGTLASGVAHEINNPINGIMNYGQLIFDFENTDAKTKEYVGEIIHETERASVIVRNLLKFSRRDTGNLIKASLKDIINDTLSLVRTIIKKDQMQLETNLTEYFDEVNCKRQQIQQVLMNPITNARDALNDKYPEYDSNKKIAVYCMKL